MDTISLLERAATLLSGSGVLVFLGIFAKGWIDRRKTSKEMDQLGAENVKIITTTNIDQLKFMRSELEETQKDLKETREQVKELSAALRKLLNELSGYRELTPGEQKIADGI